MKILQRPAEAPALPLSPRPASCRVTGPEKLLTAVAQPPWEVRPWPSLGPCLSLGVSEVLGLGLTQFS